jgi:putative sigma-54 modulation protein
MKVIKPQAKDNKEIEIKVNVPGETFIAKAHADTFEAATDLAVDKVKGQLKAFKEKLKAH